MATINQNILMLVTASDARLAITTNSVIIEHTGYSTYDSASRSDNQIPPVEIRFSEIDTIKTARPDGNSAGHIEIVPKVAKPGLLGPMLTISFSPDKATQFDAAVDCLNKQLAAAPLNSQQDTANGNMMSASPVGPEIFAAPPSYSEAPGTLRFKDKALPKLDVAFQWSSALLVGFFAGLILTTYQQDSAQVNFLFNLSGIIVVILIPTWLLIVIAREILRRMK